ncbi:MAG TPA: acyl-CoA dehydrogenase family protein [Acidimicrobiia bacterium]|nr:acyl-CoA dehydrogenase family protein [Acidimicrobiia bacterium]
MDVAERALLLSTVDAAIGDAVGPSTTTASVDDALTGLGWGEMLRSEPRDAIEIVFDALGSHNAVSSALDDVLASALAPDAGPDVAVVLPTFGTWDPPGLVDAARVHAVGLATPRAGDAGALLLVCAAGPDLRVLTVDTARAEIAPVDGVDPGGGLRSVRVEASTTDISSLDPATWPAAVASGRRALARQMGGAARAMLELARTHAVERVQFGRPVASFQAVRHHLADALVALEALDATIEAAWDDRGDGTAALAKAVAGRTARTVATRCQQVLAGVGFTTDHPFHRYLKRTMVLEGLLGTADAIVLDLGRTLLADRRVPTLLEL